MNKYNDLEMSIISCILQEPKLIEKILTKENYFIKHKKLILFLKAVYNKFRCFDINLMCNACKNEYKLMDYIEWLVQLEPVPSHIDLYLKQLEELRTELKKDKWIREKIYLLASELYVKNITLEDFKNKINKIEEDAKILFDTENV